MFRRKPKKSKFIPLVAATTVMFAVAFHWSYVLEFLVRGVAS